MFFYYGIYHVASFITVIFLFKLFLETNSKSHPSWMKAALSFQKEITECLYFWFFSNTEQFFLQVTS